MIRSTPALLAALLLGLAGSSEAQDSGFADLDPRERERALASADVAQVAEVTSLLGDPARSVRAAAAEALLRFGGPAVRPLLAVAQQPPNARSQRMAYELLRRLPAQALASQQAALRRAGYTAELLLRVGDAGLADARTILALVQLEPGLVDLQHDLQLVREGTLARRGWARPALIRALGTKQLRARAIAGLGQLEEAAHGSEHLLDALLRSGELAPIEVAYAAKALACLDQRERLRECYRALPPAARQHLLVGVASAGEAGLASLHLLAQEDDAALERALRELSSMTYGRGFVPAGGLPILRFAQRHSLPGARHGALRVLRECNALALPEASRGLRDPHPAIRKLALETIVEWAENEVPPQLVALEEAVVALLRADPELELRAEAASALGAFARTPAAEAGLRQALGSQEPALRARAALALARFPPDPARIALVAKLAEADPNLEVRGVAAQALARMHATPTLARLVLAAEGEALRALGEALADEGHDARSGAAPWPRAAIAKLLASDSQGARGLGAWLLHELAPLEVELQPSRVEAIKADHTGYVLEGLTAALTRDELRALAFGERGEDAARIWGARRSEAEAYAAALAEAKLPRAYPLLQSLRPWHEGALPTLQRELSSGNDDRLYYGLLGLKQLGPAAAPALSKLIELLAPPGEREGVTKMVVEVLAGMGPAAAPALPQLIPLLRAEDEYLAVDVYDALAEMGAAARPAFPAMLAARAVPNFSPERILEPLTRGARACSAAGRPVELGETVAALTAAVDSTDSFWPEAALGALWSLGPEARAAARFLLDRTLDPWLSEEERTRSADALLKVAPELRDSLLRGLRRQLASAERKERRGAATLLRHLEAADRGVVLVCATELTLAKGEHEREQAAQALLECGPVAAAEIGRLLSHPDANLTQARALAARLGDYRGTFARGEGVGVLRGALSHADELVRRGAALSLAWGASQAEFQLDGIVLDAALRELGDRVAREPRLLQGLGPRGVAALPALERALDAPTWREDRGEALQGIAALGSAALPVAPRLRRLLTNEESGCVWAACVLLELTPEDEARARAKLREWLPHLPREILGQVAERFGRERGSWQPSDRELALSQLERVLRYRGRLGEGEAEALRACLALGARERVEAIAKDEGASETLREAARELLK